MKIIIFSPPQTSRGESRKFAALADYNKVDDGELTMAEGDLLEVIKVGNEGWWYMRHLDTGAEGWAPASYLDHILTTRKTSHSTLSMSSLGKVI